jgi:hypothetical protein
MPLPIVPDIVPDYALDLLDEDPVLWAEDRTPMSEIEVERIRTDTMRSLLLEEREEVNPIRPSEIVAHMVAQRSPYNNSHRLMGYYGYARDAYITIPTRIVTTPNARVVMVAQRSPYNPLFDEDHESNSGNIMFNASPIKHNILLTLSVEDVEDSDNLYRECCICLDEKLKNDFIFCNCKHSFCCKCVTSMVTIPTDKIKCPLCREEITTLNIKNVENYNLLENCVK